MSGLGLHDLGNAWIKAAPLPEVRYAVVKLRSLGLPTTVTAEQIDDRGNTLGYRASDGAGMYFDLQTGQPTEVPVLAPLSAAMFLR